jgi:uncharacterized membrane protein
MFTTNTIDSQQNIGYLLTERGSLWPSRLRHEMPYLIPTLGAWVRIPLKVWVFVCVYYVFVLYRVGTRLATGCDPVQGVLQTL